MAPFLVQKPNFTPSFQHHEWELSKLWEPWPGYNHNRHTLPPPPRHRNTTATTATTTGPHSKQPHHLTPHPLSLSPAATEQHDTRSEERGTGAHHGQTRGPSIELIHLHENRMSDISMVPESTLPQTSSEAREQELELRERPEVHMPTTQESPVAVRLEDEVHDIRDEVRRLATRFDGLEERFDRLEERMDESDRRIDARFDTIKEWTDGMNEWTAGVSETLRTITAQLAEIKRGTGPGEKGNR
ncbi:hypothetical protein C7212DRAFT_361392 [Tuber magnatum]|uniref:t-SNARE coiled-coil homology domain-containing protein n=1 Tax=Tuber magnatum TaxID=42249 RepID=A0A317T3B2_9PEZI|nr:hypothetical protein C7212DRAFT_361392 [Tuber magnatum]